MSNEFYIGYRKQAPPLMAHRIRIVVAFTIVSLGLSAAAIGFVQSPIDSGGYEFGVSRTFEGTLHESPLPYLLPDEAFGALLLVGAGKQGLPEFARPGIEKHVRFNGSIIYRQNMTMIEMNNSASFEVLDDAPAIDTTVDSLGPATLTGELVDTKCFFGVMRPGVGKVHRACAANCLAGGVPPGLLLRQEDGRATVVMLANSEGQPLTINPQWAARQITVAGTLEVHDAIPTLRANAITLAQ